MQISKKTHCFNCDGEMYHQVENYLGIVSSKQKCLSCSSYSTVLLSVHGNTGKDNRTLKGILGTVEYVREDRHED